MNRLLCEQVCHAVRTTIRLGSGAPLSTPLVKHSVGCERCRGTIALLAAALLSDLPDVPHTSCTACQADLAAFIDLEAQGLIAEAARIYPHVWWHIWVCPDCALEYHLLQTVSATIPEPTPAVHQAPSAQAMS